LVVQTVKILNSGAVAKPLRVVGAIPIFPMQVAVKGPDPNGRSLTLKDVSMTKLTLGTHPYMLGFEQL